MGCGGLGGGVEGWVEGCRGADFGRVGEGEVEGDCATCAMAHCCDTSCIEVEGVLGLEDGGECVDGPGESFVAVG